MNGIENIIKHIERESEATCKAIEAEAAADCARIRAEYSKLEQNEYWKTVNSGAKSAELRLERLSGLASLESKKHILATLQELLSSAFELAAQKLLELPDEEYVSFLARLAEKASVSGAETIFLAERDLRRVGPKLLDMANSALAAQGKTAALRLSDKPVGIRGGFILAGDKIDVNCSVDALVAQSKSELSPDISELLFN